jgi:hypothetical protein
MAGEQAIFTIATDTKGVSLWYALLDGVMKLPGAKVDRESFLKREFSQFCERELVDRIIAEGIEKTHVDGEILDKAAEDVIVFHTTLVTGASFVSGLPGGMALAGTIPADLIQYYYHLVVASQKLAYVYGWPDLETDETDGFLSMITVFIGVMIGVVTVNSQVKSLSKALEAQAYKKLSYVALAKAGIMLLATSTAKKIGEKLFWQGYFSVAAKIVPLVGGVTAAGITFITFLPMSKKLKGELKKLVLK